MRRVAMRPSPRDRSVRAVYLFGLGAFTLLNPNGRAAAQGAVDDADREAARNLYKEGYELQRAGNYEGALERFERSQQVHPAPTALLHIAECEAQLHRLVEAAETYRALGRQSLPPGSPPAFVAAQTQGAAELQQVEPRIPHVRIDVRPAVTPNLNVTIDDQPLNAALLGVDRPVDPGQHRVAAMAPGYDQAAVVFTVAEKEPTRAVSLTLKPTPGVFMPGIAPPLAQPQQPEVVSEPSPPTYLQAPYYGPAPEAVAPPPATIAAKAPMPSRYGLFLGPRLGAVIPEGTSDLTNRVSSGFSLGAELDFRFARRFFSGVVVDHGFLGSASASTLAASASGAPAPTYSTTNFDAVFGFVTSSDHFGVLFQTGIGYRLLSVSGVPSVTLDSPEFLLGAGFWIPIGRHFRLVPRVDATFGNLQGTDTQGNSYADGYAMVTATLGGYYNLDFR